MITKIKAVAVIIITIAAIVASNVAQAQTADRIPGELLGCWKYVGPSSGVRNPNSIFRRIDSKDCKGEMLMSGDGWVGDYDVGKIDCRLHSVVFSDTKRGRYRFRFNCDGKPKELITSTMKLLRGNELVIQDSVVQP